MPLLQTKVSIPSPGFEINHTDALFLIGSCFADSVGLRLDRSKFDTTINPFGVLYNPASIVQDINLLLEKENFGESELNFYNEFWLSFNHHTSFSAASKEECLEGINSAFIRSKQAFRHASYIVITLGTAWAYRSVKTGQIVANCHKMPAREFTREYLSPLKIVDLLSPMLSNIKKANNKVKFIFTVSPIRHWKDGAIENARSKAALLLAIKELENSFADLYYFPVYEIFMDELRDYRYYASDMLHPSDFAVDYIWEIFQRTFFSNQTILLVEEINKIIKSFEHRPLNTSAESFKIFTENLKKRAAQFSEKYSHISFEKEIEKLNKFFV